MALLLRRLSAAIAEWQMPWIFMSTVMGNLWTITTLNTHLIHRYCRRWIPASTNVDPSTTHGALTPMSAPQDKLPTVNGEVVPMMAHGDGMRLEFYMYIPFITYTLYHSWPNCSGWTARQRVRNDRSAKPVSALRHGEVITTVVLDARPTNTLTLR